MLIIGETRYWVYGKTLYYLSNFCENVKVFSIKILLKKKTLGSPIFCRQIVGQRSCSASRESIFSFGCGQEGSWKIISRKVDPRTTTTVVRKAIPKERNWSQIKECSLPPAWGLDNTCPGRFQNCCRPGTSSPSAMCCLFLLSCL